MRRLLLAALAIAFACSTARSDSRSAFLPPLEGLAAEVLGEPVLTKPISFASELPLEVHALLTSGEVVKVGMTGSDLASVTVPACAMWWVDPGREPLTADLLARIATEVKAKAIPGLSLARTEALGGCIVVGRPGDLSVEGPGVLGDLKNLVWLDLSDTDIGDEGLAQLRNLPRLRSLGLRFCKNVTDAGLAHVGEMSALRRLDLFGTRITGAGLRHVRKLGDLKSIKLYDGAEKLQDADLAHLGALTGLLELDLAGSEITDAGIQRLKGLTSLRRLELSAWQVTGTSFAIVEGMGQLRDVDVGDCLGLTDTAMAHLGKARHLERLVLVGTEVTARGLAEVAGLTSLVGLDLEGLQVGDEGLAHLKKLLRLRTLILANIHNVTDKGIAHLADLRELRKLSLFACEGITDAGLAHLGKLTNIDWLDLNFTEGLSGSGFKHLAALDELRELQLGGRGLRDDGLADLVGLAGLRILHIRYAPITSSALPLLGRLQQLRDLSFVGCPELPHDTAAQLGRALPGCQVDVLR